MSEHTSTPWSINSDGRHVIAFPPERGGCAEHVARVEMCHGHGAANVEFIVRAVNAHNALVTACEAVYVRLHREQGGQPDSPWEAPLRLLREALALAKGQS